MPGPERFGRRAGLRQGFGGSGLLTHLGHAPLQERVKALKKEHGRKVLGEVTVEQAIGGMRGIPVSWPKEGCLCGVGGWLLQPCCEV